MKIVWLTFGFEEYSLHHVRELSKENEVLLIAPQTDSLDAMLVENEPFGKFVFAKPRLRQPLKQFLAMRGIERAIDGFEPQVVHLQQGHLWFNWWLKKLRRRYPLVITIHDPRHHVGDRVSQRTPQWVLDMGFRLADQAIVHGNSLREQSAKLFHLPLESIHSIPHVAMGGKSPQDREERKPEIDVATVRQLEVLFFGRIWDYKGLEFLIAAQPAINARVPDAKIVIAGAGDDFSKYESLMLDRERFEVHNDWISDEKRSEFFERAALVVLPYREATQSGVVPVAFNHSRPVVASRVGALSECVTDEVNGLLVPPGDVDALAAAIVRLLQSPQLRRDMGERGKRQMNELCSAAVVADQTVQVYKNAISRRNQAAREDL